MDSAEAAANTLCNPETQVSAHYLIDANGDVLSLVPEGDRAWHAGAGRWGEVEDVNSRSIGIELANNGFTPFAAAQMDSLTDLLADISQRRGILPERVIGHSDMAPERKIDPGPRFDWQRLARSGLTVWPDASVSPGATADDEAAFVDLMRRFGYTATDDPELLLKVLRLRFRPRHEGPRDAHDIAIITDLATRFPVDDSPAST